MISTDTTIGLEDLQAELDELRQMIREAETLDDLNDLHHHVGPSEDELRAANDWRETIDRVSEQCAWGKFEAQCSFEELNARERWNSLMNIHGAYENKYC